MKMDMAILTFNYRRDGEAIATLIEVEIWSLF
jgi:hypothetical protein